MHVGPRYADAHHRGRRQAGSHDRPSFSRSGGFPRGSRFTGSGGFARCFTSRLARGFAGSFACAKPVGRGSAIPQSRPRRRRPLPSWRPRPR